MNRVAIEYLAACCRGASQVMLQRSIWTGVLFLLGILAGGWDIMVLALVSLMFATISCIHRHQGYADGLWGFNAILVGCAASVFPCPNTLLLALVVYLTIPLKQILDKLLARHGISSLTLPFILSTWMFICMAHWWDRNVLVEPSVTIDTYLGEIPDVISGLLKGLSQVFLVNSWAGGLLILAGLLAANRNVFVWAIAGSAIGMSCATLCGCAWDDIANGLWGFSPALTAIAVGVTFRPETASWRWIFVTIGAVVLTFLIQLAATPVLATIGLPVLTLPFCIATYITTNTAANVVSLQ